MNILILEPSHTPLPPPPHPHHVLLNPKHFHLGRFPESVGMPRLLRIFFSSFYILYER
jgi:hypothetical protein